MPRAPFQVLVLPFKIEGEWPVFALFKRSDAGYWQGIAGGGEDDETPEEAAIRETGEEAGINCPRLTRLDTEARVPVSYFKARASWPKDTYVIPEYYFALECDEQIMLSFEHTELTWARYEDALGLLHWDNNKTALWELNKRIEDKSI